jgi:hypothetical protein
MPHHLALGAPHQNQNPGLVLPAVEERASGTPVNFLTFEQGLTRRFSEILPAPEREE